MLLADPSHDACGLCTVRSGAIELYEQYVHGECAIKSYVQSDAVCAIAKKHNQSKLVSLRQR